MNFSIKRNQAGFSFVELLISMAIFGVIMLGLNAMLSANSKATQGQTNAAQATMAARQSLLRITDLVAQAHYIYPADQDITLNLSNGNSKTITTGSGALAILLPKGSTYCPGNNQEYCGYIISVEDRNLFTEILGNSKHATNYVLAGWRTFNLTWSRDTVPTSSTATWTGVKREILVDSLVDNNNPNGTNLAAFERLDVSKSSAQYDKENLFSNEPEDKDQPNGLIASITPRIVIAYGSSSNVGKIVRSSHIFARAIPRGTVPNPN